MASTVRVGVKRDSFETSDTERLQAVLVLEPPEGALDRAASPVQVAKALAVARDERLEPGSLESRGRSRSGGGQGLGAVIRGLLTLVRTG